MLSREIGRAFAVRDWKRGYKPQISQMNTDLGLGLPGGFTSWLVDVALPNTGSGIQSETAVQELGVKRRRDVSPPKGFGTPKICVHL
jgi:hypothetical protein